MTEPTTLATVATPPQQANAPLHQPARDNAGNELPPLRSQTQVADRPSAPGAVEWARMTPAERFAQSAAERDRQDRSGPDFVHTRGPDGNVVIKERSTGRADGDGSATDQPSPPAAQGEKFKIGQYEISESDLGTMMERQAAEDLRKATMPAAPDAYEAKLPDDFKAPGGIEYKFDASDPSLIAARNWAHAKGLSQADFSELLSMHASHVVGQEAVLQERARAEIAKAGPNASQRVDAVAKWLDSFMGTADAKPIRATLVTDAHLRFYEKIMTKLTSQGTAPFSQAHRDRPKEGGGVSDAEYKNMSDAQRLDYARQFDQRQFNNPR